MNSKTLHKLTAGLAIAVVFSSCVKDENSSGYEYMPDMYRSPAIETYVDYGEVRTWKTNDSLTNRQSALQPPLGTIPFSGNNADLKYSLPYKRLPSKGMIASHGLTSLEYNDGDYDASVADINPLPLTESNVANGKVLYNRFCDHCHGEKGAGDGKVANNDAINPPASAFTKPDGQMFYSITYGRNAMGAHASQLNQKERWQVINYIKSMNGATVLPDPVEHSGEEVATHSMEGMTEDLGSSLAHLFASTNHTDGGESHGHGTEETVHEPMSVTLQGLEFETGSAVLNMSKSQQSLDILLNVLKTNQASIVLEGHTDNTGNEESNVQLSLDRANAVKAYLSSHGVDASRIEAKGYGSAMPKESNDTEEGKARNRRTEVKLK